MKLGVIGVGKMGSALLEGAIRSDVCSPDEVVIHDAFPGATDRLSKLYPALQVADSNADVLEASDVVLLCVKPGDMENALQGSTDQPSVLLVSIAAGVTLESLQSWSAAQHRIVRVMPNTPALIGEGASAFALGKGVEDGDRTAVESLLNGVGIALEVSESQLDAVTGLSGSGPAYVYTVIEALADAGVREGLPRPVALQLAAQTVKGGAGMVLDPDSPHHPGMLRDQVTSPGGTTIAGVAELERHGLRSALIEAVHAATTRSRELGKL